MSEEEDINKMVVSQNEQSLPQQSHLSETKFGVN